MRSIFEKAMGVGRSVSAVMGLMIVLVVLVGLVASTASAANGGNFILGQQNVATAISKLVGKVAGPSLLISNGSEDPKATALQLNVKAGKPPMKVNSDRKVPKLNADKVDGKEAADFLGKTDKATDADVLDGKDSAEFANAAHVHSGADITSGTVAEARIDNSIARDSEVANGFVQGRGIARHGARALAPVGGNFGIVLDMPDPGLFISYQCPTDLTTNGWLRIRNTGSETVNVFSDNGSTNPNHFGQLAPTEHFQQGAAAGGEYITLQVQGSSITTIDVFSVHRSSDCHVQAQGLATKP